MIYRLKNKQKINITTYVKAWYFRLKHFNSLEFP